MSNPMRGPAGSEPVPASPGPDGPERRRRRNRRAVLIAVAALLVLLLGLAGAAWWFVSRISSNIERIPDAFEIPDAERPPESGGDSVTFLLGGLDGPDRVDVFRPGAARTDTIMLVHVPEGRDRAYVVSIPRDTYVDIPGRGMNKINAAYSFGGPSLFVQTIEELTDIRVDHLALIDWNGFEALTDELGGVELTFDEATVLADGTVLPAGRHVLDGQTALQYVRDRKDLPGGDFDRIKRQQNFLRGLMNETLSAGTLSSPSQLDGLAAAVGQAARVDEELTALGMVQLGLSLRDLRPGAVTFMTVPTRGTGFAGAQSIVVYDEQRAEELWTALRDDTTDAFVAQNPELVTGERVR